MEIRAMSRSDLNFDAEDQAAHDHKVARLSFTILVLLIVMTIAVWSSIGVWFIGRSIHLW
jgi:hypothetical protein